MMNSLTFNAFKNIIYKESGIVLTEKKMSLLSSRLLSRLRALKLATEEDYLRYVKSPGNEDELTNLIDVISTNVTSFFREKSHFKTMQEHLKKWSEQGRRHLRIWCAAASTGQEPFTLAMTVLESLPRHQVSDIKILATDISTEVLRKCQVGVYRADDMEGIAPHLVKKYMHKLEDDSSGQLYAFNDQLKEMVIFRKLNLIEFPYPMRGPLDMIFCRNVMIYFDVATRQKILSQMRKLLHEQGVLFVGHSESLTGDLRDGYERIGQSVYYKQAA